MERKKKREGKIKQKTDGCNSAASCYIKQLHLLPTGYERVTLKLETSRPIIPPRAYLSYAYPPTNTSLAGLSHRALRRIEPELSPFLPSSANSDTAMGRALFLFPPIILCSPPRSKRWYSIPPPPSPETRRVDPSTPAW